MKIYLGTCYSDPNPDVRELRVLATDIKAAELMQNGHHGFSPRPRNSTWRKEVLTW